MPRFAASPPEAGAATGAFAADVRAGLGSTPRTLPPRWLYDAVGSALFDAICRLPWYPITRAETSLLDRHAAAIASRLRHATEIIELGPGSGDKLVRLIAPFARRSVEVIAHLVDVSEDALDTAEQAVSAVPRVRVIRHHASFEQGLAAAAAHPRRGGRLVAFLGSNIGNFDPAAAARLLEVVASSLGPGDGLLLGADLVKPEAVLQLAYDDPLGVTAAFNRNLLVRMNSELGADFDLDRFRHEARWNASASRVEMHLVSAAAQRVSVPGAGLVFTMTPGETIWTESSYKYAPGAIVGMGRRAGLSAAGEWTDADAGFALTLFTR
jgi:L-histidine Nalpha-methyltransferase